VSTSLLKAFELKLLSLSKAHLINHIATSAFYFLHLQKFLFLVFFYYNFFMSCFIG